MGRSGQGGACLASSSLPSNMDSLERRETRAGSLSSFEMAAWQSHAACEFLSGLTLRSQADVSREQQLSAGARELDDHLALTLSLSRRSPTPDPKPKETITYP